MESLVQPPIIILKSRSPQKPLVKSIKFKVANLNSKPCEIFQYTSDLIAN